MKRRISDISTLEQIKTAAEAGFFDFIIPPEKLLDAGCIYVGETFYKQLVNGVPLDESAAEKVEGYAANNGNFFVRCKNELIGMGSFRQGALKLDIRL
jgi:hypothetical protein